MIYLDYQATTPLADEAREAMLPWLGGAGSMGFANPHSPHSPGRAAAAAVEWAREQVAALFPVGGHVVFTSGASEALNLALLGTKPRRLVMSAIEHAAVLDTARASGADCSILPVGRDGVVLGDAVIPSGTDLVAVMQVNNEIGTIQPVATIAQSAHRAGALMLCDAVQGAGKLAPPDGADLIAVSAHKIYGPKGIGALWFRDGVKLAPIFHGGGQERGLRSGTLSPMLCAGFGAAAALCIERRERDAQLVDRLWTMARSRMADWQINGSESQRWHGNLSLRPGDDSRFIDVARLMSDCRAIAFSAGSACASGSGRPSHVLSALGLSSQQAKSTIRIGFGRYTKPSELAEALDHIDQAARNQG